MSTKEAGERVTTSYPRLFLCFCGERSWLWASRRSVCRRRRSRGACSAAHLGARLASRSDFALPAVGVDIRRYRLRPTLPAGGRRAADDRARRRCVGEGALREGDVVLDARRLVAGEE